MRLSLSPSRKPTGSAAASLRFISTRSVPPRTRSAAIRAGCRGWCASHRGCAAPVERSNRAQGGGACFELGHHNDGRTTSCSSKRMSAAGSASSTLVSSTYSGGHELLVEERRGVVEATRRSPGGRAPAPEKKGAGARAARAPPALRDEPGPGRRAGCRPSCCAPSTLHVHWRASRTADGIPAAKRRR